MSNVGRQMKGESIWLGHFLYGILRDFSQVASRLGKEGISARYLARAEELKAAINDHGWDGEWYIRATNDEGHVLGSRECTEGRIFLNAQTWAVLAGTASAERAILAMDAVEQILDQEYGPLLFHPSYSQADARIGYLTRYAPGTRENGGSIPMLPPGQCWLSVVWDGAIPLIGCIVKCVLFIEGCSQIFTRRNPMLPLAMWMAQPHPILAGGPGPGTPAQLVGC